jgi:NADPH:quinone reductase-like Zn-dependent oxidoreductase
VDERIVGHKPKNLDFAQAAALPLTTITAWELLFDRLEVSRDAAPDGSVAAGDRRGRRSRFHPRAAGAPADRADHNRHRLAPGNGDWVRELGAHHVIDHSKPLQQEIARLGLPPVTYVASLNQTDQHWAAIAELVAPQGKVALIDDPASLDVRRSSARAFRCTGNSCTPGRCSRPRHDRPAPPAERCGQAGGNGALKTTLAERFGKINAANLKRAHALIESNRASGKIVLVAD